MPETVGIIKLFAFVAIFVTESYYYLVRGVSRKKNKKKPSYSFSSFIYSLFYFFITSETPVFLVFSNQGYLFFCSGKILIPTELTN